MISSMGLRVFAPFVTISPPDPTESPAVYGVSTVAPLREIHVRTLFSDYILV